MRLWIILGVICILAGCSLFPVSRKTEMSQEAVQALHEENDFKLLEQHQQGQDFEALLQGAENFLMAYPYSLKIQRARFLKAGALEELGRWSEAVDTYKAISAMSAKAQPEISAKSLYRLSYVYEALGDNQRVIAILFEAAKYHQHLPPEVINAEIPARLAMIYAKENNSKEAQKWLGEAERGLKRTLETRTEPLTKKWLAELYYSMGSISTEQLSKDNIETLIHGQAAVQKYLIHALQYNDPLWSAKALKRAKSTYLDLWKAIETFPEEPGYEPLVAQKMKKEEQLKLAGPFSELIREADLYRPGAEQVSNPFQAEFFSFLEEIQTRVRAVLEDSLYTPLMPGRAKPLKQPKASIKTVPSEDPNL